MIGYLFFSLGALIAGVLLLSGLLLWEIQKYANRKRFERRFTADSAGILEQMSGKKFSVEGYMHLSDDQRELLHERLRELRNERRLREKTR